MHTAATQVLYKEKQKRRKYKSHGYTVKSPMSMMEIEEVQYGGHDTTHVGKKYPSP
jgi:hypothetical protein